MGSCMSSKSKQGALASTQPNAPTKLKARLLGSKMEKKNKIYRGTGTSFGFKKPFHAPANSKSNIPILNSAQPTQEQLANSIVDEPTARSGTPRLVRNGTNGLINRFGFRPTTSLSNKVADCQNDMNSTKANLRLDGLEDLLVNKPSMLPKPKSHLPRPQFPVRLVAAAGYHPPPRTASADKHAKTAANNHTARRSRSEHGGSSASSVNDVDSGISSHKSGGELDMIEKLECSPSARNKKSRPIKIPAGKELRALSDSIEVTEIVPLKLPALRVPPENGKLDQQLCQDNSASSEEDDFIEDESSEEKQHRDRVLSEKDERGVMGAGEEGAEGEDLWGHGEAMAGEEDLPLGQDMDLDREDSDNSPGSPGTPTHLSNSLSLSSDIRDRDFIDDEICDQPDLVYENINTLVNSSGNTLVQDESSPKFNKPVSAMGHVPVVDSGSARHSSVGTLSPCESIASDDLMMDYDFSAVDEDQRLETSSLEMGLALTDGESDEGAEQVIQEINSLLAARPEFANGVRATRQIRPRVGSSGSGADSPRSLDTPRLRPGSALSSPLRSRQGTSSPGEDISEDSGIRVNRGTYQAMYQDVINIKALLLRLSRVMQESESGNRHDTPQKNGVHSCESSADLKTESSQREVIADLQRQVLFLHSQVEENGRIIQEKDRMIRSLQMTQQPEPRDLVECCNAATQTERVRPLSTGPILSTTPDSAGGSYVSNTNEPGKCNPTHNPRHLSRLPQWRRTASPSRELHKPVPLRKQT